MEQDYQNSGILMVKTGKIIRKSIYSFLQHYQYFTLTSALFALPFSASILLSQALLVPSSKTLFLTILIRLQTLFRAAGFPLSSEFFNILSLKLSQTISSSIFALPFTLTFLLLAKATVIRALKKQKPSLSSPSFSSILSIFNPLLSTYIFNVFVIIAANSTAFFLLFLSFNFLEGFGFNSRNNHLLLSAAGAVLYSIILANALIISNLALIISGEEKTGGYFAFLKACVMIRGRTSTALSLALPASIAMAGIEALFQYRIVKPYNYRGETGSPLMIMEGMLISYMYAVFIVVDTIATCIFLESCYKKGCCIDEEGRVFYRIEIEEDEDCENGYLVKSKSVQELP